uniref:uncharacterized protein LOC122580150 n=1 Tax=Erigeron canadensis TaxID=72917 RepID=UPI001CB9252B|nr:uncharacterized protein LOC122580150 [Erigeron canadensis]
MEMSTNNNIPIISKKSEESEKGILKSRSALFDITNDSPIVGLAIGNLKTPSSTFSKKLMIIQDSESRRVTSPGSGEALLRGQVKTLLQKVEEEAVISKISFGHRNFVNSPMHILAPTPFNTPQLSEDNNNDLTISPVVTESFNFSQILDQEEDNVGTLEKNLITKLLFTDENEGYDSCLEKEDDDDESLWSVQVNASTSDDHEDNELDELCEVMTKICVNGGSVEFSDGELEGDD